MVNVFAFASTILLARLLTPDDFGLVAIAVALLAIINAVTSLSLSEALIQLRNPTRAHLDTAWTMNVARGLLIAAIFAVIARPMAYFFDDPRLIDVILVMGLTVLVTGLSSPRQALMQRSLVFHQEFVIEVDGKMVAVGTNIAIALIYKSYWALIWGALAGQIATVLVTYIMMPYRPRFSIERFKDIWSFSFWLTLSQAINTLNWRFDQFLIGKFLGRSSLGVYSMGDNLAQMPTREVATPLTRTLFPGFATLVDKPEYLRDAYVRAQTFLTTIVLPVGVGMALIAAPLVELAMGEKWIPSIFVIQALASIFALQTIGSLAQPLALSQGRTQLLFKRDCQLFAARIPIIVIGMLLGGLTGIVLARVITGTMGIGFNIAIVRSLTGLTVSRQICANARPVAGIGAMVAVVLSARLWWAHSLGDMSLLSDLALSIALGATTYIGAIILLWALAGFPDGPERDGMRILNSWRASLLANR